MSDISVKIQWLHDTSDKKTLFPRYQTAGAAGMDICSAAEEVITIKRQEIAIIPVGFALEIPDGYEAQIRPRSGLAAKYGITLINSPGTIDSDYRGEIKVPLINLGKEDFSVKYGERIAQLLIAPVCRVRLVETDSLGTTKRGNGGFGHTGR